MSNLVDGLAPEPPVGTVRIRLVRSLVDAMLADLRRPHAFAFERVGWMSVTTGRAEDGNWLILGQEYHAIPDEQYLSDDRVGARIGTEAIHATVRRVLATRQGLFHVHLHDFPGQTGFSPQDLADQPPLVTSWTRACPLAPHGMLVLSSTSAAARVWLPGASGPVRPEQIAIVGYPTTLIAPRTASVVEDAAQATHVAELGAVAATPSEDAKMAAPIRTQPPRVRSARQSFLGAHAQPVLSRARIGIAGLGGGGSHLVQQLAHVGVLNVRAFDGDTVEESNLNRLVGALASDVAKKTSKIEVARRMIEGVLPDARPLLVGERWQEHSTLLRGCDLVFGSVDTFAGRHELEVACRRYGIPYIDIGMDVYEVPGEPPRMAGQIILSMPGCACMWCLQFLDEEKLAREAQQYGDAGGRPQVVWPNGVLASTAVGIAVDLLTGWTGQRDTPVYLSYDGNTGVIRPHPRLQVLGRRPCPHYPPTSMGDPVFKRVSKESLRRR